MQLVWNTSYYLMSKGRKGAYGKQWQCWVVKGANDTRMNIVHNSQSGSVLQDGGVIRPGFLM